MIFFSYLEFSLFIYMFFAAVIKHLINFKSIFRLNDVWVLILLLPISFSYTSGGNWSFLLFLLFLIVITDFETPLDFFIYLFKIITALSFSLVSVVVGLLLYWGLNLSILYKFPPFYSHKIAVLIFLTCFLAGVLFAKNKPAVFLTEYLSKLKMHKKYFYSILGVQLTLIACLFILALTAYYFNSAIEIIVVFSVLLLLFFTVTILVMFFSFKTVEQENHLKTQKKKS
ncbi:hypothetical protein [Vagococcus acidifermentans]|uniref:Uncharacterized protein n=2 Tax=Vagococcus acidifermentans TaxID=564710 RepID=A0A430ATW0_9ENTE|nr:hypothetical protein CBF27_08435 [Vagococcus acidifermentans]